MVGNFTVFKIFAIIIKMKCFAVPNVITSVWYSINKHKRLSGFIG